MAKSKSKYISAKMATEDVAQLAENWQRCRSEDLSALFTAYSTDREQTERVVSFQLSDQAFTDLLNDAKGAADLRFIVHLGLKKSSYSEQIPTSTAFVLLIEAYETGTNTKNRKYYQLEWDAKTPLLNPKNSESGVNAIPGASVYLFIHEWLETPDDELGYAFNGLVNQQDRRVKSYVFDRDESKSITNDMNVLRGAKDTGFFIHLGSGPVVTGHPFAFHPVIEVRNKKSAEKSTKTLRNATGVSDGSGGSYYDFANPQPPQLPDVQ